MMQFNTKVNVIRLIKTPDNVGSWTESENVEILNLPCRINWAKGTEKILADKKTHYRDAKLFCKCVDIDVENLIVYKGTYYEIVNINNPDEKNKFLVVDIKRKANQ